MRRYKSSAAPKLSDLLREGLRRGVFSPQERNGWPQNVWAVTEKGEPLEAQRETDGVYHGYPMPLPHAASRSLSGRSSGAVGAAMMPGMSIELKWLPPFQGTPEIGRTSATIQIRFGSENATRSLDAWSESVQDSARVPAYPLAIWLASSWWRIRWEPLPSRIRLTHDHVPAGTSWP